MSNNDNFTNFNSAQVPTNQPQQQQQRGPQIVHVPYTEPTSSGRITFNKNYLFSIAGIVRLAIIVIIKTIY